MENKNYFFSKRRTLSFLILFLFFTSFSFASLQDGLVLHYSFDNDTEPNIVDVTGHSSNALIQGAGVISTDGKAGKALYLPTVAKPAADYVQLPDGIVESLTDFTITVWVKLDNHQNWARILDFGTGEGTNMFLTGSNGGVSRFVIKTDNVIGEKNVDGPVIPTGTWTHIAVIGDLSNSTVRMYFNGVMVGENTSFTSTPASMGTTTANYLGKAQYNDPGYNGYIDELKIYNRPLSRLELMEMLGINATVVNAFDAFDMNSILGTNVKFNEIDSNLTLPTSFNGAILTWTSSDETVVTNAGVITQKDKTGLATLTVVFSAPGSGTLTKTVAVTVLPAEPLPLLIAKWQFGSDNISMEGNNVVILSDEDELSGEQYKATLKDVAQIRTIGTTKKFNVLDLGDNKGHMDMGAEIGKSFTKLTNYAVGAYFRIDDTAPSIDANGNFLITFANTEDILKPDEIGYLFLRPRNCRVAITKTRWDGEQAVDNGAHFNNNPPYTGTWHHMFFVQDGNTGTVYIDGQQVAQNTNITLFPAGIARPELDGTPYNWIGRACYAPDSYLRKTLVYDFRLYSIELSADDLEDVLEITATLDALNTAYAENPDVADNELTTAHQTLTLSNLSNVSGDITLPSAVAGCNNVKISWKSSDDYIIGNDGKFNHRPILADVDIILTAQLMKNGKILSKDFTATVKTNGTPFQNDLLVKYDFSEVNGKIVTDQAEKHFKGTLENEAKIRTLIMQDETSVDVLDLGNGGTGYFDMGREIGQVLYNTGDYTMSAYVRVDTANHRLYDNGNFLWCFSNTTTPDSPIKGYAVCTVRDQRVETRKFDNSATRSTTIYGFYKTPIPQGEWIHIAYTQEDSVGILYMNGEPFQIAEQTMLPLSSLRHPGYAGTFYNWLGRPNWPNDINLSHAWIYDFRMYGKVLYDEDFLGDMKVAETLEKLNNATSISGIRVPKTQAECPYSLYISDKQIVIEGLSGNEKIELYDISGRRGTIIGNQSTMLNPGIYIVKINNFAIKVLVK